MKKVYFVIVTLLVATMVLSACGGGAATSRFKVGQVTDLGGIDDKSFNATAYAGVEKAVAEFGVEGKYLESPSRLTMTRISSSCSAKIPT